MRKLSKEALERIAYTFGRDVPGLTQELQAKLKTVVVDEDEAEETAPRRAGVAVDVGELPDFDPADEAEIANERIVAITAGARPVARIRNNQVTTEFLGPDNESWAAAILTATACS